MAGSETSDFGLLHWALAWLCVPFVLAVLVIAALIPKGY